MLTADCVGPATFDGGASVGAGIITGVAGCGFAAEGGGWEGCGAAPGGVICGQGARCEGYSPCGGVGLGVIPGVAGMTGPGPSGGGGSSGDWARPSAATPKIRQIAIR
jgi:hypothetical protein